MISPRAHCLAAALAASLVAPPFAAASVWDGDAAVVTQLIAILSQLEQSYRTLHNQLDQIEMGVKIAKDAARRLPDARSFTDLNNTIQTAQGQYTTLRFQVEGINYQMKSVRGQFDALFPGAKKIPANQLYARRNDWYREVSSSARTAMAGQSLMENTEATNRQSRALVDLSRNSQSQMQQLQVMNQLLATLTTQMSDLTRMLATSNRALSSQIAARSAEEQLSVEHTHRMWDLQRYNRKPPPAKVRSRLPKPGSK